MLNCDIHFTWQSKIVCVVNYYFDKLTELKAEAWEKEKELRQKINQMQKEQAERIENLQVNNLICITWVVVYVARVW